MSSLGSTILLKEAASADAVEEALARQVLHGGDLATNLLELGVLPEPALLELVGETLGIEPIRGAPLGEASAALRRLISADHASRYDVFPLRSDERDLELAVAGRMAESVVAELEQRSGRRVVLRAALVVRIREAIARDYGTRLDRRTQRVLASLAGMPDPAPSLPPTRQWVPSQNVDVVVVPAVEPLAAAAPEPQAPLPPGGALGQAPASVPPSPTAVELPAHAELSPASGFDSVSQAAPTLDAANVAPGVSPANRYGNGDAAAMSAPSPRISVLPAAPVRRSGRHHGPFTAADAEHALRAADTAQAAARAFFDFARQYFEYSALFAVQGDVAEGRDASGPGATSREVRQMGVPLGLDGLLDTAVVTRRFVLATGTREGLDGTLAQDLRRPSGRTVLVLPIEVRNRAVLLLYGDDGDNDVLLENIGDVIGFASLVGRALERIVVHRKRERLSQLPEPPAAAAAVRRPAGSSIEGSAPPSPRGRATGAPAPLQGGAQPASSPPLVPPTALEPTQAPFAARSELAESAHDDASNAVTPQSGPGSEPVLSMHGEALLDDWELELPPPLAPLPGQFDGSPRGPAQADAAGGWTEAHEPLDLAQPVRPQSAELPSVIVDLAEEIQHLVVGIASADPGIVARLIEIGEPAVGPLVSVFPGPVVQLAQSSLGDRLASDCGPVLAALSGIGGAAVPFLTVRTADTSPAVRQWATRLLGELPADESVRTVVERLADTHAEVRHAAAAAARSLLASPASSPAIQRALVGLIDARLDRAQRHKGFETIAELRLTSAIPALIECLRGEAGGIVRSAEWALKVIARQDFGTDPAAWQSWWDTHQSRHRVEWLIDTLLHPSKELRQAAGDELKELSKQYFGFFADQSESDRNAAHQRYREWWESRGKARFVRAG